jgi:uncharacterized glyoxalase superfamily protein PhnB
MENSTPKLNETANASSGLFEMQSLAPNIYVRDMEQTITFYQFLGFKITTAVPDDKGNSLFVLMQAGKISFMFQTFESIENSLPAVRREDGGSLLLYINIKGIRSFYERVKDNVTVLHGLEKTFYGATEFSILDPNHYLLTFAEDE